MLLAEVELALGSTEVSGKLQGGLAVKALQAPESWDTSTTNLPLLEVRQEAQCKFQHPAHDDGKYHCYTCGATSHKIPDCPYNSPTKEDEGPTATGASKGSPAGGSAVMEKALENNEHVCTYVKLCHVMYAMYVVYVI